MKDFSMVPAEEILFSMIWLIEVIVMIELVRRSIRMWKVILN
ncbi:hypothetical protein HRED_06457 [Candidatus Haloredivivus sp. G17]|nr:hypothetical protein HRED_06457 [Candidatus Haloredivivus sp. G17]